MVDQVIEYTLVLLALLASGILFMIGFTIITMIKESLIRDKHLRLAVARLNKSRKF